MTSSSNRDGWDGFIYCIPIPAFKTTSSTETISALLAVCAGNSPAPGEFPTQRTGTRSFDVFFDLRLNKRFSKQSCGWWFKTQWRSLWRHGNVIAVPVRQKQVSRTSNCIQHCLWNIITCPCPSHYSDVTMGSIASQITSLTTVSSTDYSDADQRKHQSSASLAFVRGIHRRPLNSPHKWPVTRKMFPFDDIIMRNDFHPVEFIRSITCTFGFDWIWMHIQHVKYHDISRELIGHFEWIPVYCQTNAKPSITHVWLIKTDGNWLCSINQLRNRNYASTIFSSRHFCWLSSLKYILI